MYADTITESMAATINETNRRRSKQLRYNEEHHITPQQIRKQQTMGDLVQLGQQTEERAYVEPPAYKVLAVAEAEPLTDEQKQERIKSLRKKMQEAAAKMEFVEAAILRDEMLRLQAE